MSVNLILDANVFLELPFEEGNYCANCDKVFSLKNDKKTTHRIMENEITPIHEDRILILNDIEKFYEKNKGSKDFPIRRKYMQTTFEFKDDVLNRIVAKDSKQIIKAVRDALILIDKMMSARINSLMGNTIQKHNDQTLAEKLNDIMRDIDDVEHVIDASIWVSNHGPSEFVSINRKHFSDHETEIADCVKSHYGWQSYDVDFTHPTDY